MRTAVVVILATSLASLVMAQSNPVGLDEQCGGFAGVECVAPYTCQYKEGADYGTCVSSSQSTTELDSSTSGSDDSETIVVETTADGSATTTTDTLVVETTANGSTTTTTQPAPMTTVQTRSTINSSTTSKQVQTSSSVGYSLGASLVGTMIVVLFS
ncbi:hypothetical protein BDR26DRAFT_865379, partial [Obelidium mucronatum]